jgi:hypothetical protein
VKQTSRCTAPTSVYDPGWVELKIPKRDENDILAFDLDIERACHSATQTVFERLICSIAIERPRVFTQVRRETGKE